MDNRKNRDPERISRENTALVVIDVQERLYPHISGNEGMATEIIRLVKFADILGIPVVHAEQFKLGPTIAPIAAALGDRTPVIKETFGCFGCADFAEQLPGLRGGTLVLVGIETHVCVLQTSMEALKLGYRVQVAADAAGSRSPYNKEIGLRRLAAAGVEVTVTESVMFELMGRSNTDEFRKVLALLK